MQKIFCVLVCSSVILLNTACTHSVLWNKYYKEGMRDFEARNYADAENRLALAVRQAQHSGMPVQDKILSLRALAVSQMVLGKYPEALLNYQNASELIFNQSGKSHEFAENLEDIGINLAKQKKYEEASAKLSEGLEIFEQLKVKDAQMSRLLQSLAFCQQKSGKTEAAAKTYSRYFENCSGSSDSGKSNNLVLLKEYRKILTQLKRKTDLAKTDLYLRKLSAKA